MKFSTLSLLPILAIAAACGGSGSASTPTTEASKPAPLAGSIPGNAAILAKIYNPDYDVPNSFFVDERAVTSTGSYTVHHVLDDSNSYEVCSDDMVTAQAWEQADNDSRAVQGYFVTVVENDRYFEFVRELSYDQDVGNVTAPTSPGYGRVFKCSYMNRDGVDRNLLDGYSGRMSDAPLHAATLQKFTEYLWQFRFFNVSRKIVLDSYSRQQAGALTHTLLLAFRINQGTGQCERIDVVEWDFRAEVDSGEVTREFKAVRSFEAQITNGTPRICD